MIGRLSGSQSNKNSYGISCHCSAVYIDYQIQTLKTISDQLER